MRSSQEVYEEVAKRCSSYDKKEKRDCCTNSIDTEKSCLNCRHFADDEHCKLDLYDPIVKNIK
ncbi:MAG: hypothetical protein ACI4D8_00320 [Wujia sp.]